MAKQAREQQLFWVGPMHPVTGEPAEWFSGIPARDLDETDIAHMTDTDYETALNSTYYQKSEPTGEKAKEQKAAKKTAAKQQAAEVQAPQDEPPQQPEQPPEAPNHDAPTAPAEGGEG